MSVEIPARFNLAALVLDARVAEGRGAHVALRAGERAVTYAALVDDTNRLANVLASLGIGPDDRVLIALPDGVPFVTAVLATLKVGAVVTMANPELPAADYAAHLAYSRAKILFADGALVRRALGPIVEASGLVAALVVDAAQAVDAMPVATTSRLLDYAAHVAAASPRFAPALREADAPAIWIATSGSTGHPRACVHGARTFAFSIEAYARGVLGLHADDVTLSAPKLYFGYGTGMSLLFPLAVGATAVLFPERPTPERLYDLIARHRPTVLALVPTLIAKLLATEVPPDARRALAGVRLAVSAGETLPVALHARWLETFGVEIVEGLGSAEMFHIHVSNRVGDVRAGWLGRLVPGYEARVVRDDGTDAPDGEIGALWMRGGSAALGYEGDPQRTAAVFRDGWVATSDKVRREAGAFRFEGRSDDMLKVGGIYVSPLEVENVLLQHPAVAECAVVGYEDEAGLVKPKAVVVSHATASDADSIASLFRELEAFAREHLAAFKVPRRWDHVPALPRNDRGKIVRRQLR
jgi:benzoate-CoA ligase